MKFALLAAAALLAGPAFAQSTGGTGSGTPVGPDAKTPAASQPMGGMSQPTPQTDPSMSTSPQSTMSESTMPQSTSPMTSEPSTATSMQSMPQSSGGSMTAGGYQPAMAPTPGTFQQAPSPDQAYPAPAPLAEYPVCKRGQYDKCMQRGGR